VNERVRLISGSWRWPGQGTGLQPGSVHGGPPAPARRMSTVGHVRPPAISSNRVTGAWSRAESRSRPPLVPKNVPCRQSWATNRSRGDLQARPAAPAGPQQKAGGDPPGCGGRRRWPETPGTPGNGLPYRRAALALAATALAASAPNGFPAPPSVGPSTGSRIADGSWTVTFPGPTQSTCERRCWRRRRRGRPRRSNIMIHEQPQRISISDQTSGSGGLLDSSTHPLCRIQFGAFIGPTR